MGLTIQERADQDIVATEVYTTHFKERKIMRTLIYVLAGSLALSGIEVVRLAERPLVYRYVRINEMGQAAPVSYNDLDYSPREGEIKSFLTQWASFRYERLKASVSKSYPRNFFFMSEQLANDHMSDDIKNRTIAKVITGQTDENEVTINNVLPTSLGKEQIGRSVLYGGTALIDMTKKFTGGSTARTEHWQVTVNFYLNPAEVDKRAKKFPEFATYNPLGLIITYFNEAQANQ